MRINATQLRADLYRVLDRILETGEPVEIERQGKLLRIAPVITSGDPLERLVKREGAIVGNPDDLVHVDWSQEWKP